jgi:hypothetical protein
LHWDTPLRNRLLQSKSSFVTSVFGINGADDAKQDYASSIIGKKIQVRVFKKPSSDPMETSIFCLNSKE